MPLAAGRPHSRRQEVARLGGSPAVVPGGAGRRGVAVWRPGRPLFFGRMHYIEMHVADSTGSVTLAVELGVGTGGYVFSEHMAELGATNYAVPGQYGRGNRHGLKATITVMSQATDSAKRVSKIISRWTSHDDDLATRHSSLVFYGRPTESPAGLVVTMRTPSSRVIGSANLPRAGSSLTSSVGALPTGSCRLSNFLSIFPSPPRGNRARNRALQWLRGWATRHGLVSDLVLMAAAKTVSAWRRDATALSQRRWRFPAADYV